MRYPDRPTTTGQWVIITWTAIIFLLMAACWAFYRAATSEDRDPAIIDGLRDLGVATLGLAVLIAILAFVLRRVRR